MIATKTVLVLGAGASVPYGFPPGSGLNDIIRVDPIIDVKELHNFGIHPSEFGAFRQVLNHAGRSSVDMFLEARPEFVSIGKLAIASALLPRERMNTLFSDWPEMRLGHLENTVEARGDHWYELLFNRLTSGREFEDVDFTSLGVVTFNYDRSLEHYLFTALVNSYGRPTEETAAKLGTMQIVHVHGSLGRLPWQPETDTAPVPYGDTSVASKLQARDSIEVLHETRKSSPEFGKARQLIGRATKVYFLGFGFHHVSLQRLGAENLDPPAFVGGTAINVSYDTIERVAQFKFFANSRLGKVPTWQNKDVYRYLYDHVSFID